MNTANSLPEESQATLIHLDVEPSATRDDYSYFAGGWDLPYLVEEYALYVSTDADSATTELVVFDEDGIPVARALVETEAMPKALDEIAFRGAIYGGFRKGELETEEVAALYRSFRRAGGSNDADMQALSIVIQVQKRSGSTEAVFAAKGTRKAKPFDLAERYGAHAATVARTVADELYWPTGPY